MADTNDLVSELRGLRQDFREDIRELRGEIGGLRQEMRDEIGGLRKDLRDDFRLLIGRQDRQFYILLSIMLAGFGGMLATMAHGFKWI